MMIHKTKDTIDGRTMALIVIFVVQVHNLKK